MKPPWKRIHLLFLSFLEKHWLLRRDHFGKPNALEFTVQDLGLSQVLHDAPATQSETQSCLNLISSLKWAESGWESKQPL